MFKIISLSFMLLPGLSLFSQSFCQIAVTDQMLIDEISQEIQTDMQQSLYLQGLLEIHEQIKDTVTATFTRQFFYQHFLKQTGSTAGLQLFDMDEASESAQIIEQTAHYLQDYAFAQNLASLYQAEVDPAQKSQWLFEQLIPFDTYLEYTKLSAFKEDQKQRKFNLLAFDEMRRKRRLYLAQAYRQSSENKIMQAQELQEKLLEKQAFSMTEGERMKILQAMQQYFHLSLKEKTRADELLQQSALPAFDKAYTLKLLEYRMERENLKSTRLF